MRGLCFTFSNAFAAILTSEYAHLKCYEYDSKKYEQNEPSH